MKKSDVLYYRPSTKYSHLDIGCNVGALLSSSEKLGANKLIGIDINKHGIEKAKENFKLQSQYQFYHTSADELKLESNSIDFITSTEVLEHIPEEIRKKVINNLAQIIKEDGIICITVPHKGIFAFLDPSNFRFYFPNFFKAINKLIHADMREKGFQGEKHGVIFHHHFTIDELDKLFSPSFQRHETRFRGVVFAPLIEWICFPLYKLHKTESTLFRCLKKLQSIEYQINCGKFFGYNVLATYKKKA